MKFYVDGIEKDIVKISRSNVDDRQGTYISMPDKEEFKFSNLTIKNEIFGIEQENANAQQATDFTGVIRYLYDKFNEGNINGDTEVPLLDKLGRAINSRKISDIYLIDNSNMTEEDCGVTKDPTGSYKFYVYTIESAVDMIVNNERWKLGNYTKSMIYKFMNKKSSRNRFYTTITNGSNYLLSDYSGGTTRLFNALEMGKYECTGIRHNRLKIQDELAEQTRVRYAMFDRPTNGLKNVVIDSFVPRVLYASKFNISDARAMMNAPKTSVAISPWFANMFGVKQMSSEMMCRVLGYDKRILDRIVKKVKRKKLNMHFIGYGGTVVNTVHWINEILDMTGNVNLFDRVHIYEKESAEISNLLRFPIDPTINDYSLKRQKIMHSRNSDNTKEEKDRFFLLQLEHNAKKLSAIGTRLNKMSEKQPIINNRYYSISKYGEVMHKRTDVDGKSVMQSLENNIIYGAPGISTRQELSPFGRFISGTHGNESCRLDLNPEQDDGIQVESYGIIQLGGFFMNQLRLAIGLLEALGSDQDMMEMDKCLMEYSFTGESVLPTDRTYNFQLNFDGLMLTEDQAANLN